MNLKSASDIAIKICERLQPFCSRINIAGSIRRQKPEVKDIEVVCLPRMITVEQGGLFDEVLVEKKVSDNFVRVVKELGKAIKGNPGGRMMQIQLPQRISLDLFTPEETDYFRQLVIRTGSRDYVQHTIASGWKRIGWCGSDKGLRKISDCIEHKQPDGKSKWECINPMAELPPIWPDEKSFFDWLKVPFIHPKYRTI